LIAWLHTEMGYHLVGPTSLYRLCLCEIEALQRGYETLHEKKDGKKHTGRRKSDDTKLSLFKRKRGLD